METLFVVADHRNQYHSRSSKGQDSARFGSFGSPPSRDFREINCRTFQSGTGILPTPLKACYSSVTKQAFSSSFSPKTPSPSVNIPAEQNKYTKRVIKSSAVSIPINTEQVDSHKESLSFSDEYLYSELWAGPAYSNSPSPSSLPIPKFSIRPKRTVSLDLPAVSDSGINLLPIVKSAPPSPTREHKSSHRELFYSDDSATKTLRRILNLDMTDE